MSGVTPQVRQTVIERDGFRCCRCKRYLPGLAYSLHHRRARGAGGSKRPDTNLPGNLLTLCGSATTPDGCHTHVERHRDEARAAGFLLYQGQNPVEVPVETWRGIILLDNEGGWAHADRLIPNAEPERPF